MDLMNSALRKTQDEDAVNEIVTDMDYVSLNDSNKIYKSLSDVSNSDNKSKLVIDLTRFETPLGTMFAGATTQGICLLEFADRKMLDTEFKQMTKLLNAPIVQGDNLHFELLHTQLNEYFEGKRSVFTIPLVTPGTAFQQAVWKALQHIPYGTTRSYKQQAVALNNPDAVRAVANANGMNRIAIVIPCHRIIGSGGSLTGYSGGIWRKKWLLDLENEYQLKL